MSNLVALGPTVCPVERYTLYVTHHASYRKECHYYHAKTNSYYLKYRYDEEEPMPLKEFSALDGLPRSLLESRTSEPFVPSLPQSPRRLHKILWVAVSSTSIICVGRHHHLQSVCLQDVVLVEQTDENSFGLSLVGQSTASALQPRLSPKLSSSNDDDNDKMIKTFNTKSYCG
ncbi:hypothetical protein AVEN_201583-1 [Araneus ventricosus]|uniref:Uncharacterized protein n=1 Tax=Araneus ventricosus TaxID=182803 RepID=A0A4Y2FDH7_ARAVE|nr:hypothetical protein AVEN_201583-1 [Araneus ventricosus]